MASFATLLIHTRGEVALLGNCLDPPDEFVSPHNASIGQLCPKRNGVARPAGDRCQIRDGRLAPAPSRPSSGPDCHSRGSAGPPTAEARATDGASKPQDALCAVAVYAVRGGGPGFAVLGDEPLGAAPEWKRVRGTRAAGQCSLLI